jgi:hypothetical protein
MNLELGAAARDAEAVLRDRHRRTLSDDVAPKVDPRRARELEPQARRFGKRTVYLGWDVQRFEHDQSGTDSPGVRRQPSDGPLLGRRNPARQVDHQEVDRSTGQERTCERKPLGRVCGPQDHEPAQVHPSTDRLEWIE